MTELTQLRELAEKLQRENGELRAIIALQNTRLPPENGFVPSYYSSDAVRDGEERAHAALDELARHSQASGEYDPPADAA